jgi:hypothetical protein
MEVGSAATTNQVEPSLGLGDLLGMLLVDHQQAANDILCILKQCRSLDAAAKSQAVDIFFNSPKCNDG